MLNLSTFEIENYDFTILLLVQKLHVTVCDVTCNVDVRCLWLQKAA